MRSGVIRTITVAMTLLLPGPVVAAGPGEGDAGREVLLVPGGEYLPLYGDADGSNGPGISVETFRMDKYPVTNADFLRFVKAHPEWRRSAVARVFADPGYLGQWESDLDPGEAVHDDAPVTRVSWFAAKAYCASRDMRLPTVEEWEYAASPESQPDGGSRDSVTARILEWYSRPTPEKLPPVGNTFANKWGVEDLHGLVWEWTLDFNSAMVTGESRGDSSLERKFFCGSGSLGASDFRDYAAFMRYAFRSSLKASFTAPNLGFRCAADSEPETRKPK